MDKVVINTEAHAFPRFELGNLFSTGWKRKTRGADGKIAEGVQATIAVQNVEKQVVQEMESREDSIAAEGMVTKKESEKDVAVETKSP